MRFDVSGMASASRIAVVGSPTMKGRGDLLGASYPFSERTGRPDLL
jgi:hypothetical protein